MEKPTYASTFGTHETHVDIVERIIMEAMPKHGRVSQYYVIERLKCEVHSPRLFNVLTSFSSEGRNDGITDDADINLYRGAEKMYRDAIRALKKSHKVVVVDHWIYLPDDPKAKQAAKELEKAAIKEAAAFSARVVGFESEAIYCRPQSDDEKSPLYDATGTLIQTCTTKGKPKWKLCVRKGSLARLDPVDTIKNPTKPPHWTVKALRDGLIKRGILKKSKGHLLFTEDYTFDSPSSAGSVVMGSTSNGTTHWKTASGESIKTVIFKGQKKKPRSH